MFRPSASITYSIAKSSMRTQELPPAAPMNMGASDHERGQHAMTAYVLRGSFQG